MIPFGDADERLREPAAKEARLAELPHCRVDALNHLLVQEGVGEKVSPPKLQAPRRHWERPRLSSRCSVSYTCERCSPPLRDHSCS